MIASTKPESTSPSRRALLAGALGGLGAFVASAIGRANPTRAEGQAIVVGGEYTDAITATSIYNQANDDTVFLASSTGAGVGLYGLSSSGYGVAAHSAAGHGVSSTSGSGTAVYGHSGGGVGLYGATTTGLALQAVGRAKFSTSGIATIHASNQLVTITPGVNVTSSSFVLLTPKTNIGSRSLWFTANTSTNRFTIHMSASRSSGTKVAWLLLG
jgi:hypothetical protein